MRARLLLWNSNFISADIIFRAICLGKWSRCLKFSFLLFSLLLLLRDIDKAMAFFGRRKGKEGKQNFHRNLPAGGGGGKAKRGKVFFPFYASFSYRAKRPPPFLPPVS